MSPTLDLASTLAFSVFSYALPLRTIFLCCKSPQGWGLIASSCVSPICSLFAQGWTQGAMGAPQVLTYDV